MTDLSSLIHRLETAEKGRRELDEAIMAIVYVQDRRFIGGFCEDCDCPDAPRHKDLVWIDPQTDKWVSTSALPFTTSLDAAVALADKALKVYRLDICMDPSGVSAKVVWWPKGLVECDIQIRTEGMGATPAASIIIAVLKAYPERRP